MITFANARGVFFQVPVRGKPGKFYLYKFSRHGVMFIGEV